MINPQNHVCWNITPRCNAHCTFCHRMNNIHELSLIQNNLVLERLIAAGIDRITWTGGEALLYNNLEILMKKAKKYGITNQLITNGKAFDKIRIDQLAPLLTTVTLSLDSCTDDINARMGRGKNQYERVTAILDYFHENYPNVKIKINSVACRMNMDTFDELAGFVETHDIDRWKIFRFMDLRGDAVANKKLYWITEDQFSQVKKNIIDKVHKNGLVYSFVDIDTIESDYLLVRADGEVVITHDKVDIELGNLLKSELHTLLLCA